MEGKLSPAKNTANGIGQVKFLGIDGVAREFKIDGKLPGSIPSTEKKTLVSDKKSNTTMALVQRRVLEKEGMAKRRKRKGKKGNNSNKNATSASGICCCGLEAPKTSPAAQVVDLSNLNPSNQHKYQYPQGYAPYQAYVVSHNAAHPSISVT